MCSLAEQFLQLRRAELGRELVEGAFLRILVGPPAEEAGAVAEAPAGDLVVADLGDECRPQRLPLGRARIGPAARAARSIASEAWRLDQLLERPGQLRTLVRRD